MSNIIEREISLRNNGFAIVSDKTVLLSNQINSHYIKTFKSKNHKELVNPFLQSGLNVIQKEIAPKSKVFMLGEPTSSKNSFILLSSMVKATKIDLSNVGISSFVNFPYEDITKKDENKIKKESKKISRDLEKSINQDSAITKKPISQTTKASAIVLAVVLLSTPMFYVQLADAHYQQCAENAINLGNFEEAKYCNEKAKELNHGDAKQIEDRGKKIDFLSKEISKENRKLNSKNLSDKGDNFIDEKRFLTSFTTYYMAHLKNSENTRALNGIAYSLQNLDVEQFERLNSAKLFDSDNKSKNEVAKEYYKKMIEIYNREQDKFNGISGAFVGLGEIESEDKNYSIANGYFDKTLELYPEDHDFTDEEKSHIKIAKVNLNLGKGVIHLRQSDNAKAENFFKEANRILNNTKTLNALGDITSRMGKFIESQEYYEKSRSLNTDDRFNIDSIRGLYYIHLALANAEKISEEDKKYHLSEYSELRNIAEKYDKTVLEQDIKYIRELMDGKNYFFADLIIDSLLSDYNDNVDLLILRSELSVKQKNIEYAIEKFTEALEIITREENEEEYSEEFSRLSKDWNELGRETEKLISLISNFHMR